MTEWHQLTDADGPADVLPLLLAQLEPGGSEATWQTLWSRVYSQGTVYGASFAILPELLAVAEGWPAEDRVMPLVLAGAIAASEDLAPGAEEHQQRYMATAPALATLADRTLSEGSPTREPGNYVHLLQALLAFKGDRIWGRLLAGLADEEFEAECPNCQTPLVIALREDDHSCMVHDFVAEATDEPLPLRAGEPDNLTHPGRALHDRACLDHEHEVADQLTYLFGHATCPRCRTPFRVSDAVVGDPGR
jgi:hypothetical protein